MSEDETKVILERTLWGTKRKMGRLQLLLLPVSGNLTEKWATQWVVGDLDGNEAVVDSMTALAIVLDGKGKGWNPMRSVGQSGCWIAPEAPYSSRS